MCTSIHNIIFNRHLLKDASKNYIKNFKFKYCIHNEHSEALKDKVL